MLQAFAKRFGALAAVATFATACSEPGSMGQVDVTMQQTDATLSPSASAWFSVVAGDGSAAVISKDAVQSLTITVTEIQFLPKDAEGQAADDGVWVSLPLAEPAVFDLMALPTEGESPLVITSGSVAVGDYGDVRLFVSSAQIVFAEDVNLGVAFSFTAGEPGYPVDIPSGSETGIKTDAEFTVEADTDVSLFFSPSATFLNVSGTGDGRVILAPVIRSMPDDA